MDANYPTTGDTANVAAEELMYALSNCGIPVECEVDGHGVSLDFADIRHAEVMMSLVFDGPDDPGSLYDRATGGCVSASAFLTVPEDLRPQGLDSEQIVAIFRETSWVWEAHPVMVGRVVDWHTTVTIPTEDALCVAARLNELRNGGAL